MYDLLSLFSVVWHMEDAKMYDLLSLFFWGLAYGIWKILRCTICCLCFGRCLLLKMLGG